MRKMWGRMAYHIIHSLKLVGEHVTRVPHLFAPMMEWDKHKSPWDGREKAYRTC